MLTKDDCDTILDALQHAKLNVGKSRDNLPTKHASLEKIEAAERAVRAIRATLP